MLIYVAYYRVSTKRQGQSGLGLEAQQKAVLDHASRIGATIAGSYTEIESGRRNDRPELARAMAHARRSRATLCVAKLDRLSRNMAFLSALMEAKVEFLCCDNPHATNLTIHILAAVAQNEVQMISRRVKDALQAAKARGTLLGSARPGHWTGREDLRLAGSRKGALAAGQAHHEAAEAVYADLRPAMLIERQAGRTLTEIAARLNAEGHTTRTGKQWGHVQVGRVLA